MAWFSLAKMALQAGTHIFKKRQETKMAMADAQHMHAQKMAQGQERLDLDKMRAMMPQENQEAKLKQNEELAGLRAGVSLAKQQMADASKIHDFGRNFPKKKV